MSQCVRPRQVGCLEAPNHKEIHVSFIWLLLLDKKHESHIIFFLELVYFHLSVKVFTS